MRSRPLEVTHRLRTTTLVLTAMAVALMTASTGARAIGMLDAYRAAVQNDPTYRMAVEDHKAGQEYRIQGLSNLLPNLSATYSSGNNRYDITQPDYLTGLPLTTHPVYKSYMANISLRQPIINWDGVARYKIGIAQTKFSDAQFAGQRQDLAMRLVGAYIDALFAEDQIRLATAQRDAYLEQRHVNDMMFKKGEGTRTDMLETQARLDNSEAQLVEVLDLRVTARQTLAGLIGKEVQNLDGLPKNFSVPLFDIGTFDSWEKMALVNNSELASQVQQVEAARQAINQSRAGHTPRLDFVGNISKNNSDSVNTLGEKTVVRSIGIQLSIPIYSGGSVSSASRQSVANYEKAKADLEARTDKVLVEVRKQYNLIQSTRTRITALEKSEESAKLLVEATTQSIKGGIRINLDLLTAVQQLYTTQRDLAQARYNYLLAYLRLRNAGGVLTEYDVQTVAGYFSAK